MFCTFLLLKSAIAATLVHPAATTEPAWLQVCDPDQNFQLNAADCDKGLWLKEPLEVGCICVYGVWMISSDLCDTEAQILVGAGDCFNAFKPVRYILLIGNPQDPFSPSASVVTTTLGFYKVVPEHGYNSHLEIDPSLLVAINPNGTLERSDQERCVVTEKRSQVKPVHIWKVPRRESNQFKWVKSEQCSGDPIPFDYHVGFGEVFQELSVLPVEVVSGNCAHRCGASPGVELSKNGAENGKRGRVALLRSVYDSGEIAEGKVETVTRIRWDKLYTLNQKLSFIGGSGLTDGEKERRKDIYLSRFNLTEPAITFRRETREQTVRMVQTQMNFLLLGQSTVKINTIEYDYFQMARQIFSSVVPKDLVPPRLVNGLMRMWRRLLWEAHDKFAHTEAPNPAQHARIITALTQCHANVSKSPMVFVDKMNGSSHGCLDQTAATFWNDTEDPNKPGYALMIFISNTTIPENVRFRPHKLDFVVELAWKIVMFTHYHCSTWFETAALDHSFLATKLLSLFNQKIIKRWLNPEDSLKAYRVVFPRVNFRDVAYATDRVVEASRDGSRYQMWLSRPKLLMSEEDKSGLERRKKRSVRQRRKGFSRSWWNGRAACINSLRDPVDRFRYKLPRHCTLPSSSAD